MIDKNSIFQGHKKVYALSHFDNTIYEFDVDDLTVINGLQFTDGYYGHVWLLNNIDHDWSYSKSILIDNTYDDVVKKANNFDIITKIIQDDHAFYGVLRGSPLTKIDICKFFLNGFYATYNADQYKGDPKSIMKIDNSLINKVDLVYHAFVTNNGYYMFKDYGITWAKTDDELDEIYNSTKLLMKGDN